MAFTAWKSAPRVRADLEAVKGRWSASFSSTTAAHLPTQRFRDAPNSLLGRSCFRGLRLEASSEEFVNAGGRARPRYETVTALLRGICWMLPAVEAHRIDLPGSPRTFSAERTSNPWFVARLLGANFCRGRVQPKDSLLVIIGPRLVGLEPDQAGSLAGGSPADQGSVLTTDRRDVTCVSVACGRFHPASRAPYQRHLRIISPDPSDEGPHSSEVAPTLISVRWR